MLSPLVLAERIPIVNSEAVEARLKLERNAETDAKCIHVDIAGVGPICRLEVDSRPHRPHGRSHKHALRTASCPGENLKRDVRDRPDLAGRTIHDVFAEFCRAANIEHRGRLLLPEQR